MRLGAEDTVPELGRRGIVAVHHLELREEGLYFLGSQLEVLVDPIVLNLIITIFCIVLEFLLVVRLDRLFC